ncbi:unnamed protein product [Urochloa humidicola]
MASRIHRGRKGSPAGCRCNTQVCSAAAASIAQWLPGSTAGGRGLLLVAAATRRSQELQCDVFLQKLISESHVRLLSHRKLANQVIEKIAAWYLFIK